VRMPPASLARRAAATGRAAKPCGTAAVVVWTAGAWFWRVEAGRWPRPRLRGGSEAHAARHCNRILSSLHRHARCRPTITRYNTRARTNTLTLLLPLLMPPSPDPASPRLRPPRNRYNEWVLCLKGTDGDEDACKGVRQMASSICPVEWVSAKPQPGTLHTTTSHVQIAARLIGVARKLCCARHLGVASAPSVSAV